MITMVSAWRYLRGAGGFDANLEVICRLPDASSLNNVEVQALDLGERAKIGPKRWRTR